ncbi:MAG: UbiD family decarboxylase [Firmicutes bacterium]|nr:UbiD family decarboxylase [Bacillota bacterium]
MALSLRCFLDQLRQRGNLWSVAKPVDPRFELGAIVKKTRGATPILFKQVVGYNMPVAAGVVGSRELLALSMGVQKDQLMTRIVEAITNPGTTRSVATAPAQENVLTKDIDLMKLLPVPTFHEKDSAPFITAAVLMVKDPMDGRRFTSIRRMQLNGPNCLSIVIESPGLLSQYEQLERQGKPLEVALIIGVHPVITLSSQLPTQTFGLDKMAVASALAGEPIRMVNCIEVDLEVPADAEIVLEGRILPKVRKSEGPFGELFDYYGPQTMQPVVEISTVTFRYNPIFQVIFPSSYEHKMTGALMRETILFNHVRHVVPTVKSVNVTMAGGGRCHAIISIKKTVEGQGKQAIFAAFAANKDIKHVLVVDDDVDIFEPEDVEWAIASRVQADQGVIIVPGGQGTPLEPSHVIRGVSAKMGIDATCPLSEKQRFERARIPGYDHINLDDYLTLER